MHIHEIKCGMVFSSISQKFSICLQGWRTVNFQKIRIGNQSGKIRVENALFFEVSLAALASQQAVSTVLMSFAVIKGNGK